MAEDQSIVWYDKRIKLFQKHFGLEPNKNEYPDEAVALRLLKRAQEAEVFDKPPRFDNFGAIDRAGLWGAL